MSLICGKECLNSTNNRAGFRTVCELNVLKTNFHEVWETTRGNSGWRICWINSQSCLD